MARFVGENYNIDLSMTEICKIVREYLKKNFKDYKFSVRKDSHNAIDITLKSGKCDVFSGPVTTKTTNVTFVRNS